MSSMNLRRQPTLSAAAWVLAGAAVLACGAPVPAQGDKGGQDSPPARKPEAGARDNAEGLRRVVDRQLERLERQREGLEEARAMIERGEPADAVRKKLRESIGALGGQGGPPGPGADDAQRAVGDRPGERDRRQRRGPGWPGFFDPGREGGPGGPEGPNATRGPEGGATEGRRTEEMLRFIEKNRPEVAKRLRELREKDPEAMRALLRDQGEQVMRMMREQRSDPGLWEARMRLGEAQRESFNAARAARALGDGAGKDKAVERLRAALLAQFDARAALGQLEIAAAKARAEQLAKQLENAVSRRDPYLAERLEKAMSGEELMDPPGPGPEGRPAGDGREDPERAEHRPGGQRGDRQPARNPPPPGGRGGRGGDLFEDGGTKKEPQAS